MNKKMTITEIDRKIKEAEQRIKELFEAGDLKRLTEGEKYPLASHFELSDKNECFGQASLSGILPGFTNNCGNTGF